LPEPTAKGYRHIAEAPEAQRLLNAIIEEIRASGESSTGFPGDVLIRPTDAEELLEAARSRRGARPSLKLLPVSEDLALDVSDVRMLEIRAVYGNLTLVGSRCDAIEIVGPVNGSAVVAVGDGLGRIVVGRGDRSASFGRGKILGEPMVKGPPSVDVVVQSDSSVDSLHIHGVIRSLECRGDVAETITICDIGGVTDDVHLHGSARRLWLLGGGRIDGELIVDGRLDSFEASGGGRGGGHLGRSVVLNPSSRTSVDSLSELVDDRIALNSNVDLSGCSIGQIPDLQKVRFVGGSHFAREHGRIIIQDEVRARRREDADFASVAHTYRALRSASVEVYD